MGVVAQYFSDLLECYVGYVLKAKKHIIRNIVFATIVEQNGNMMKENTIKTTSDNKVWLQLMNFGRRLGCHQRPDRSFFIRGYQFPVCARCTGVILGELITIILLVIGIKISIIASIILLLIMGFDWFIQYIKLCYSTNFRRLITGLSGGIGLTYIYYYALINLIKFIQI